MTTAGWRRTVGRRLAQVAVLALTAVVVWSGHRTTSASTAPDPATAPRYAEFYRQTLQWQSCFPELTGDRAMDCAGVRVPLDWAHPEGASIELRVARHRATGGHPQGSLLLNPGGPGASGVDLAVWAPTIFGRQVVESYDLVGWDPRGVGTSSGAVSCLPDELSGSWYDEFPDTPAEVTAFRARWRERGRGCLTRSGDLLRHVDTMSTVRDLDVLRAALGDRRLNLYAASYGTLIGARYAETFPARVARIVLDSPEDPTLDMAGWQEGVAVAADRGLTAYLAACPTRSTCPFPGRSTAEAVTAVRRLADSASRRPLPTGGAPLDGQGLLAYARELLPSPPDWPRLDALLTWALQGGEKQRSEAEGPPAVLPVDGVFDAVSCLDRPEHRTLDQVWSDAEALDRRHVFGSVVGWSGAECLEWPVPPVLTPGPVNADGAAPILVVGSVDDAATPYEWARSLTSQLASARLLTYAGADHAVVLGRRSACATAAADDYLLHGTLPAPGTTCPGP